MNVNNNHSPSKNGQGHSWLLGIIFLMLALVLAAVIIVALTQRVVGETTLFDTDEAAHATPALELYVAFQRLDVHHFARAIIQQSFYPPVHSLSVLATYWIASPSLATTRMSTVVTFALLLFTVAIFTFRTTSQIEKAGSGLAFIATSATVYFVSTSPVLIQNAVICMLELLGCLWAILLLWLCWRLDQSSGGPWIRAASLALPLMVITLTKYTFGIIAISAVVVAILTGPMPGAGKRSQLIEAKAVLLLLAVGLGFWFIIVGFQGVLGFAFNQPQYAPFLSAENILYYPLAWLNDFHLHPIIGITTGLLAFWGAIKGWNQLTVRTASWATGISLLILTISLNNQPRHFAFAAPFIWFLAAQGLTQLLVIAVKASRSRLVLSSSLIVIFALLGLSALQRADELQPHLTDAFEGRYGDRNKAMQSYILDNVDLDGRILIFGMYDQLNAMAIRWQSAISTGRAPSEIFVDTSPPFDLDSTSPNTNDSGENKYEAEVLRAAATQGYYSQIVVIQGEDSTDPFIVAAPGALSDYKSTSREFGNYRIDIYEIGEQIGANPP